MKTILIKELRLENFKKHKNLVISLDGRNAAIFGDNATGKSSIYDALTWLLFGRDSKGNGEKNIEVKPLNALGEVADHDAITSVEAVLSVDGEKISLKREFREVWATRRGSATPVFEGNVSDYYIDGVPVKKNVFSKKIDEIVDENTFKLLTSVSHFADGISWQERRNILFMAAGIASDTEIMSGDERFSSLLAAMGKLSLEDYKKKLLAEKRGHVGTREDIPARISECEKTIADVSEIDFGEIRREIDALSAEAESIRGDILAVEREGAAEKIKAGIREAQAHLDVLEAENKAYRASQTSNTVDVGALRSKMTELSLTKAQKESRITMYAGQIAACDRDIAASRERWISVNAERFTGGVCPTCNQSLPAPQLKAAEERFEAQKAQRLRDIEQTANARKGARGQTEERIAELREEIENLDKEITAIKAQIKTAEENAVPILDLCDYEDKKCELDHEIAALSSELADMMTSSSDIRYGLQDKLRSINNDLASKRALLGRESLIEYSHSRIEQLKEDARRAAEQLEAIDGQLFLIDEFSRYKTQFVEDSINSLFRIARFRLFREQANGGLEDRCDVVCDGVPYINLNSGARINVGLDIINTLSMIYGVSVPLFVDNAESVTALEPSQSQVIRLIVSENDKELRVETV